MDGGTHANEAPISTATAWAPRLSPRLAGVVVLVLALAHLVLVPGRVVDGHRVGWNGALTAGLGFFALIAWLIGSLLVAYIVLCDARAALRLLGLPAWGGDATRLLTKGTVASLVAIALLWPGITPTPYLFALLPLASTIMLMLCLAQRHATEGPWATAVGRRDAPPKRRRRSRIVRSAARVGRGLGVALAVLVLAVGTWFFVPVSTPPFVDAQGHEISGSIATMEAVDLNGSEQWIVIRGRSATNPVLLILAGGPGGSALGDTLAFNSPLEDHFVVVTWEQPGAGKSFPLDLTDNSSMTLSQYVSDGLALTAYLRARFHQRKIYLLGSSWGSFLGVWMVQQRPKWFTAYIGEGQMTSAVKDDQLGYDYVLQHARAEGNTDLVQELERNGPPPYDGLWGQIELWEVDLPLLGYEDDLVRAHGGDPGGSIDAKVDIPEYRPIDMAYALAGPLVTATTVYPELDDVDLATQATTLKVPVFFAEGRYDLTAMTSLALAYFQKLKAPSKTWVWFDHSGHTPSNDEADRFNAFMVNTVLARTQRR